MHEVTLTMSDMFLQHLLFMLVHSALTNVLTLNIY